MTYSLLVGYDDIVGTWVHTRLNSRWTPARGTATGIVDATGKIIAGVTYTLWNGPNVLMDIVAEPKHRWCTRAIRWALFAYPFNILHCKRVTALVDDANHHSKKFVSKVGFVAETSLMHAAPSGGDTIVYRFTQEQFQDRYPQPALIPNIIKAPT